MACSRLPCLSSMLKSRGHLLCGTISLSIQRVAAVGQLGTHMQTCQRYQVGVQEEGKPAGQYLANIRGQLRCLSTKAVEGEGVQHMPLFQRFWRWLHDLDDMDRWDNPPDSQAQAELDEREAFLNRVQAMYFADPPQRPDLQFCRDSLEMLMKYNDRVAVETLWNILPELKVTPDEELEARVQQYLKRARLAAHYE